MVNGHKVYDHILLEHITHLINVIQIASHKICALDPQGSQRSHEQLVWPQQKVSDTVVHTSTVSHSFL